MIEAVVNPTTTSRFALLTTSTLSPSRRYASSKLLSKTNTELLKLLTFILDAVLYFQELNEISS